MVRLYRTWSRRENNEAPVEDTRRAHGRDKAPHTHWACAERPPGGRYARTSTWDGRTLLVVLIALGLILLVLTVLGLILVVLTLVVLIVLGLILVVLTLVVLIVL